MAIDITTWGIDVNNTPEDNTDYWNQNIQAGQEVYLPVDPNGQSYEFDKITIVEMDNIEFYGEPDNNGNLPVIEFSSNGHTYLEIKDADSFTIRDLIFDGKVAKQEGGVWARDGATNGLLKNLTIYDAAGVSLVVGNKSKSNPAYHVDVEDCTVRGQRLWGKKPNGDPSGAKAMILAGGYGYDITFKNCNTYSVGHYPDTDYSPADHFDTDNATDVEYHNCTADGTGTVNNYKNRKGKGFWNEAGGDDDTSNDHETSATYYGCTAFETGGGLAAAENSDVKAYNFYFDKCSAFGWAARCQGEHANLEIYNSTFYKCYSQGNPPYLEGGVHFSVGSGVVENCTFTDTPDPDDPEEAFNVSFYTSDTGGTVNVTLESNTFDKGAKSHGISEGSGTIYISDNDLGPDAEYVKHGNYNWISSSNKESATATAINSPTGSTTVYVLYENHGTDVQYNDGESLNDMLFKMRDAVNADPLAHMTAAINTYEKTITFTQKDAASADVVNFIHEFSDWGNGLPFNPMSPMMA